jgi:hypothetical protein
MLLLQILSALLLLLNKFFVFQKKTIGWILGMFGTIAITIYFYIQMTFENKGNFWIMIVYDIALFFLMAFGYIIALSKNNAVINSLLQKWSVPFKVITVTITVGVCSFLLLQALTANLVIIQFLSSVGGLMGTLFLAFNTRTTNQVGWVFYCFTHCIVTYLFFKTDSPFLAVCQIGSAIISVFGLYNEVSNKKILQPLKS